MLWGMVNWKQAYQNIALAEIRDSIKDGERLGINDEIP